jgi:hypothetical protein
MSVKPSPTGISRNTLTSHEDTRHVLVTSRDYNHAVQPVPARRALHLIRDQVSRLQRERHAAGTHRDTVANADGAELVANEVGLYERLLDSLP